MWNYSRLHDLSKDDMKMEIFLKERDLLLLSCTCPKCGSTMKLSNGLWRCRKTSLINKHRVTCNTAISERRGSWFGSSKLSYGEILKVTYGLIYNYSQIDIRRESELNKATVSRWASYMRQVLVEWSLLSSEKIGGPGKIVEIDESKFGKRKYNRGHYVEGQWVFGGVERGSGKMFMVPVEKRDAETLVRIIKEWILPGTTIISDCWRAYQTLGEEGYQHLTVNHSINFVDPETNAHTNTVEGEWRHAKLFMPKYNRRKENYPGYLAHYMFKKKAQAQGEDLFEYFLKEVSKINFDISQDDISDSEEEEEEY